MPTIEMLSVGATSVPMLPLYDGFAYIAEVGVRSHRDLFQSILDQESGVIVHLANKEFEGDVDGGWFAGALMMWDDCEEDDFDPLVFEAQRFDDVVCMLTCLMDISPDRTVIFLSDYQFGPDEAEVSSGRISLASFRDMHQRKLLRYNTLYRIQE